MAIKWTDSLRRTLVKLIGKECQVNKCQSALAKVS